MNLFPSTVPSAEEIHLAARRITPFIHHTPVFSSRSINKMFQGEILFKCENVQKVGAFKARGAINAIKQLPAETLKHGVCTHSSGNHAQALSWAASMCNTKAFIVMPSNSSRIKVDAVREYGGEITFCEPTLAAREATLEEVARRTNAVEVHPYNNYAIIAGQATAALELIEDYPGIEVLLAPVGGGGLLSGTALATSYFSPAILVIAAEPEQADDACRSFQTKTFIPSIHPNTIADGLRTSLGTLTLPIILDHVHDIVTASEKAIITAMRLLWERLKLIVEPSASVPLAAILEKKVDIKGKRIGIILSGGNVDFDQLPWITHG
jgi:threonine dehydratase